MIGVVQRDKIYREQKTALRCIENKDYRMNYNKAHKENKIIKTNDIILIETLKFAYKLNNGKILPHILKYFEINTVNHNYNTRHKKDARTHKHRTAIYNKSVLNQAPYEWAKLDLNDKNKNFIKQFIADIKNKIISRY